MSLLNSPYPRYLLALLIMKTQIYNALYLRRLLDNFQELLIFPDHQSSPPVFSGICVARSLVLYVALYRSLLALCHFSLSVLLMTPLVYSDDPFGIFKRLFIRSTQSQRIGEPNIYLIIFGARKPKGLQKRTKICYGHLTLRETNLSYVGTAKSNNEYTCIL